MEWGYYHLDRSLKNEMFFVADAFSLGLVIATVSLSTGEYEAAMLMKYDGQEAVVQWPFMPHVDMLYMRIRPCKN